MKTTEEIKAHKHEYYIKNRESTLAFARAYRQKNKEEVNKLGRIKYNKNIKNKGVCDTCGNPTQLNSKICRPCSKLGDKNPQWKGDNVSYRSLHEWVNNNKPKPELCEMCREAPPQDCANISGTYLRNVSDYKWICRRCHMVEDNRMLNLTHNHNGN